MVSSLARFCGSSTVARYVLSATSALSEDNLMSQGFVSECNVGKFHYFISLPRRDRAIIQSGSWRVLHHTHDRLIIRMGCQSQAAVRGWGVAQTLQPEC